MPTSIASPKHIDRLRDKLGILHYAGKTEKAYVAWGEKFLRFHEERTGTWKLPEELGKGENERYLTHFAVEGHALPSKGACL